MVETLGWAAFSIAVLILLGRGGGGQARILLAAWSRAFKADGPNRKGTQLSSKWMPSIVGKDKRCLLRRALAMFACLLSSYLARRGARGRESHSVNQILVWDSLPQFLNCGLERRKKLSRVLHIRSCEFTTLFFYESLKFSIPSITMQDTNHIYDSNNYDSTMSKSQEYFWQHFNDDLNSLLFCNYSG